MISTSVKQLIAWPIAFGLSAAFFLGCFEALKHLPSKSIAHQHSSLHPADESIATHKSEHPSGVQAEKSHSVDHSVAQPKGHPAKKDLHSDAATAEHISKPAHAPHEASHGTKTH